MLAVLAEHAKYSGPAGYVLVTVLMVLSILSLLGMAAISNTLLLLQMSANEKAGLDVFYQADGGALLGARILEESLFCPELFSVNATLTGNSLSHESEGARLEFFAKDVGTGKNLALWDNDPVDLKTLIGPKEADVAYQLDKAKASQPGKIAYAASSGFFAGESIALSPYHNSNGGYGPTGVGLLVDIYSYYSDGGGRALVQLGWRHLPGKEGPCIF